MSKPFSVNFFGSHPDEGNDDCWSGEDFASLEEAKAFYDAPVIGADRTCTAFVVLDGPGLDDLLIRANPDYRPDRDTGDWKREVAHQAGMMGGCAAYNEVMGY